MSNDPNVFLKTLRGLEFEEKTPPIKIYFKNEMGSNFQLSEAIFCKSFTPNSSVFAAKSNGKNPVKNLGEFFRLEKIMNINVFILALSINFLLVFLS